jgi:NMD protein affecting ribosome stability and mRNA decay
MDRSKHGRKDRLIRERRHDTYREREKPPEPTRCTECSAVFANGRWSWNPPEKNAHKAICPACRRTADRYPAATIQLAGEFFSAHREEIENLIRNVEEMEKTDHPLERIMAISDEDDHTLVTTTGIHIARRIGEALSRSYKGDYRFQYGDGEKNLRVYWKR